MSLTAASEQLEKVRMELDNKFLQNLYLGKEISYIFIEASYHIDKGNPLE